MPKKPKALRRKKTTTVPLRFLGVKLGSNTKTSPWKKRSSGTDSVMRGIIDYYNKNK